MLQPSMLKQMTPAVIFDLHKANSKCWKLEVQVEARLWHVTKTQHIPSPSAKMGVSNTVHPSSLIRSCISLIKKKTHPKCNCMAISFKPGCTTWSCSTSSYFIHLYPGCGAGRMGLGFSSCIQANARLARCPLPMPWEFGQFLNHQAPWNQVCSRGTERK